MHGDDRPHWHWPRIENIPKDEMDLLLSPLPEEYRFRPISEANQSSETHLDIESEFMDFSKGWHQLMTDGKPPKKVSCLCLSCSLSFLFFSSFLRTFVSLLLPAPHQTSSYGRTLSRRRTCTVRRQHASCWRNAATPSLRATRTSASPLATLRSSTRRYFDTITTTILLTTVQHLPYTASPWAERLDVKQRAATKAGLEVQRAEREKEAYANAQLRFEEEFKKAGGEELNLAQEDKEEVRVVAVAAALVGKGCIDAISQRDPEDSSFLQPDAHDSKTEEMFEQLYVMPSSASCHQVTYILPLRVATTARSTSSRRSLAASSPSTASSWGHARAREITSWCLACLHCSDLILPCRRNQDLSFFDSVLQQCFIFF